MSSNWIGALDGLAAGGVIDFDAAAFLLDQKPRYIGHPQLERLPLEPDLLPPGVKLRDVPQFDEFSKEDNLVQNPAWKKWLFGGVVGSAVAAIALAIATKGKSLKWLRVNSKIIGKKIKNFDWKSLKDKVKLPDFEGIKKFFSDNFKKLKNFKK